MLLIPVRRSFFVNKIANCVLVKNKEHFNSPVNANNNSLDIKYYHSDFSDSLLREQILEHLKQSKEIIQTSPITAFELVNPRGVFANNEIDLQEIKVFGFDYDYTLAQYNTKMYELIFNLAKNVLVDTLKYPNDIRNLEYNPKFPIRGLHLDKSNGWLMKIDSYHNIQMSAVYHGLTRVHKEKIKSTFNGSRLNIDDIGHTQSSATFHHFVDLFCMPEISLFASIIQYFIDQNINFTSEYIFKDIRESVDILHRSNSIHAVIAQSIDDYLFTTEQSAMEKKNTVLEFIHRLYKYDKKIFLITNSPFWFVNIGMQNLCGSDWMKYFDLIICSARKPYFFTSKSKPFRKFNLNTNSKTWQSVKFIQKSEIYYEGNLFEMLRQTGW
jgi:HAD superfamily 5'-nucleotidase-like hydrolase